MRVYSLVKLVETKPKLILAYEEMIKQLNNRLNELENEKAEFEKQIYKLKKENADLQYENKKLQEEIANVSKKSRIEPERKANQSSEPEKVITGEIGDMLYRTSFEPGKGKLVIPEGYTEILTSSLSKFAFNLRHVVIPKSMKKIDKMALSRCYSLSKVEVDASNPYFCVIDGVLCSMTNCEQIWRPLSASAPEVIDKKLRDYIFSKTGKSV